MSRNKQNFILDMVNLALLGITLAALALQHNPGWYGSHAVAGTLVLMVTSIHLVRHAAWMQHAIKQKQRSQQPKGVARANRYVNIALLVLFLLCGGTGLALWGMQTAGMGSPDSNLGELAAAHRLTGILMTLLVLRHLKVHLRWMRAVGRQMLSQPLPSGD